MVRGSVVGGCRLRGTPGDATCTARRRAVHEGSRTDRVDHGAPLSPGAPSPRQPRHPSVCLAGMGNQAHATDVADVSQRLPRRWLNATVSIVPGQRLDVPEGRLVRTMEAGTPGGTPVLVFHPTPSSRLFVRQHADAALRQRVRLVGFSRPGSGGSSMASPGLRLVAEDAVRVADATGLESFAVLGFSGGTPFAAATAALFPDRVRAVGLCAVVAPLPLEEVDEVEAEKGHLAHLLTLDNTALAAALVSEASPADAPPLDAALAASQAVALRGALEDDTGALSFETLDFDHAAF